MRMKYIYRLITGMVLLLIVQVTVKAQTTTDSLKLRGTTSGNKVVLLAHPNNTGYSVTLPAAAPLQGQFLRINSVTGTAGIAAWQDSSAFLQSFWGLKGNAGTTAGTNFIGTTDAQDLIFEQNNIQAGWLNASSYNTAFGVGSLPKTVATPGLGNSAFGYQALANTTSNGNGNTAMGYLALNANTVGSNNTAIGTHALQNVATTNANSAFGSNALQITTGTSNVAIGTNSLSVLTGGGYNTALGMAAAGSQTSGGNNIAIGYNQQLASLTGSNQLNIGGAIFGTGLSGSASAPAGNIGINQTTPTNTLHVTATANPLRLDGLQTGALIDSLLTVNAGGVVRQKSISSVVGYNWSLTGNAGTTAGTNFIGTTDAQDLVLKAGGTEAARVLQGTTQANSAGDIVIGTTTAATVASSTSASTAAQRLAKLTVTGGDAGINGMTLGLGGGQIATNSAIGYQALYSNTTGNVNQANGYQALYSNTTGNINQAIGYQALSANTGSYNQASGIQALYSNTTGSNNYASGYKALYSNTSGGSNQASGYNALFSNTTGSNNLAVGYSAVYSNLAGNNNTGIGNYALQNSTGSNNVALGYQAANTQTAGNNNITLGYNQQLASLTGSNQLNIGGAIFGTGLSGSVSAPAGLIGINQPAPTNALHVTATSNPLRLDGLQTGALTDQILTANATGVVRQQTISSVLAGSTSHTMGLSGSILTSTVNTVAPTVDLSALPIAGDVTGTQAATVVTKINGSPLGTTTTATNGQVLTFNGTNWVPSTPAPFFKGRVACTGGSTVQTVNNTNVTATSTIIVTYEDPSNGSVISVAVGARVAGTSFNVLFGATPPTTAYINYTIMP